MTSNPKNKKLYYLSLFFCTVGLCIPAFINNDPFLYSDTGTYIEVGFNNNISYIRPMLYGVLIRHISLHESFWIVIIAQALIVSGFIHLFARQFFKKASPFFTLLLVALLTACTSIGITTGMLMPDFTTPILLLATALLLFGEGQSKWELGIAGLGLWFSLGAQQSFEEGA